jgi:hypothetical protein
VATITFNVELIYEGTGHYLDFEYEHEFFDDEYTQEEIDQYVDDLVTGRDPELYNEIMANISIVPTFDRVDM